MQRSAQLALILWVLNATPVCAQMRQRLLSVDAIGELNGRLAGPISQLFQKDFSKPMQLLHGASSFEKYMSLASKGSMSPIYEEFIQGGFLFASQTASQWMTEATQAIPFLLQSSINLDAAYKGDFTFSANALAKLIEFKSSDRKRLGLLFGQGRVMGTSSSGTTWNAGFGLRHLLNEKTMLGFNSFWDYRIAPYGVSYTRWGAGFEMFWQDFEFRNNWYISGSGVKDFTIDGVLYNERVVPGWDFEVGYRLPENPQAAIYLRTFLWDYMKLSNHTGAELAVNYQASPHSNFEAYATNQVLAYPTVPNSQLDFKELTFGLRFSLYSHSIQLASSTSKDRMQTLMVLPVRRQYGVLLERWKKKKKKLDSEQNSFSVAVSGR